MRLHRYESRSALSLPELVLLADDPGAAARLHHVCSTEQVSPTVELDALDEVVAEALATFAPGDTSMDGWLAPRVHSALPLRRREAADPKVWGWLTVERYPGLVPHRWKQNAKTGAWPLERLTGDKVRQTLARLWWAAELTMDASGDYGLTRELFSLSGFQDAYEAMFGREFCGYRPALSAFIQVAGPHPEKVMRETAKQFSNLLSTVVVESLSEDELKLELGALVGLVSK